MAAFDSKGKNFRHEIFEEYKANRSEMPDEIQLNYHIYGNYLKV